MVFQTGLRESPGRLVARANKVCTVAHNICCPSGHNLLQSPPPKRLEFLGLLLHVYEILVPLLKVLK